MRKKLFKTFWALIGISLCSALSVTTIRAQCGPDGISSPCKTKTNLNKKKKQILTPSPTSSKIKKSTTVKKKTASNNKKATKTTQANKTVTIIKPSGNEAFNEELETAIDEGNDARDKRDYVRAEKSYRRAQSIRSDDSRAVYGLGNIYSDQQRWEEAEKAYREAIRIEPNSEFAYISLSYVLVQPTFGSDMLDRFEEAAKLARRAIQLEPELPFAYDLLGLALELRGVITQETENAYRRAIQIDSDYAPAYAHLGRFLRRKGLLAQSNENYGKAIRLATDVPTMIEVAEVFQSQQKYEESERLLRNALKKDPKNPTALFLLGRALTTRKSYDEAKAVLEKSLQISPDNFIGYILLGSVFTLQENFAEAEKYLFKALQVVSASGKKRLALEFETLGDGLMRAGKRRDAARVYQQAVALDAQKTTLAGKLAAAKEND